MADVAHSSQDEYESRLESLAKEIFSLLQRAGILEEVERLERLFEPDFFRDKELAPFGTETRKRQLKEREKSDGAAYQHGIRRLYFRIADSDIRIELIKKERDFRRLQLQARVADLHRARRRLYDIESKSTPGFGIALSGLVAVLIGAGVGNVAGALAAAVFATLLGIHSFRTQQLRRDQDVAAAKADIEEKSNELRDEESRPDTFSHMEELTGEPDQTATTL